MIEVKTVVEGDEIISSYDTDCKKTDDFGVQLLMMIIYLYRTAEGIYGSVVADNMFDVDYLKEAIEKAKVKK